MFHLINGKLLTFTISNVSNDLRLQTTFYQFYQFYYLDLGRTKSSKPEYTMTMGDYGRRSTYLMLLAKYSLFKCRI